MSSQLAFGAYAWKKCWKIFKLVKPKIVTCKTGQLLLAHFDTSLIIKLFANVLIFWQLSSVAVCISWGFAWRSGFIFSTSSPPEFILCCCWIGWSGCGGGGIGMWPNPGGIAIIWWAPGGAAGCLICGAIGSGIRLWIMLVDADIGSCIGGGTGGLYCGGGKEGEMCRRCLRDLNGERSRVVCWRGEFSIRRSKSVSSEKSSEKRIGRRRRIRYSGKLKL